MTLKDDILIEDRYCAREIDLPSHGGCTHGRKVQVGDLEMQ